MSDSIRSSFHPGFSTILYLFLFIQSASSAAIEMPCHRTTLSESLYPPWLSSLTDPTALNEILRRDDSGKKTAIIASVCTVIGIVILVFGFFYLKKHIHEAQEARIRKRDEDARKIRERMKKRKSSRVSESTEVTTTTTETV